MTTEQAKQLQTIYDFTQGSNFDSLLSVYNDSNSNTSSNMAFRTILSGSFTITNDGKYLLLGNIGGQYQTNTSNDIIVTVNDNPITDYLTKIGNENIIGPRSNLYYLDLIKNDIVKYTFGAANNCTFYAVINILKFII